MALLDYPSPERLDGAGPVLERIRRGRGEIPNPYRMLLHSPGVVDGWVGLANTIRFESSLPDRARELAILLVAHLTGCGYEWHHHSRLALDAGLSPAEVEAAGRWPQDGDAWPPQDRAVLAFTAATVERRPVPPEAVSALRAHLGDRGVVELGATVAYYLGMSHFLLAFDIEVEGGQP